MVYYQDIQEKIKKEANLKTLIKEVELNALKNQINPHFLFNTLNTIYGFALNQSKQNKAERDAKPKKKKKKVIQEIMGDDLREQREMLDEIV